MKKRSAFRHLALVVLVLAALMVGAARAGGPLYVGGPSAVPGVPFRWILNPVTYWTDLGSLGLKPNADADTMVAQAFQVWQDVPTANITFAMDASNSGKLRGDVDASNIVAVLGAVEGCGDLGSIAKERSIIYDVDGSAIQSLGMDENSVLGFASPACPTTNMTDTNFFLRGYAVLNGRFLDGIDTPPPTRKSRIRVSRPL